MDGTIQIRAATMKEAPQITELSTQLGYPLTIQDTITNIAAIDKSNYDMAYVAVLNEQVVGWIHVFYTLRLETGPFCEIGGLVVAASARGKGVGSLLVEKTKKWAAERNIYKLKVRCQVKRAEAHAFYEKNGFEEKKVQKVFEYMIVD